MIVGEISDLADRISVDEVTSEVVADSRSAVDSDDKLRICFEGSKPLERHRLIEQIGAVRHSRVLGVGDVLTGERLVSVTENLSLTDILVLTCVSDEQADAILRVSILGRPPDLDLVIELSAAPLNLAFNGGIIISDVDRF